jgi:hypothetical protein
MANAVPPNVVPPGGDPPVLGVPQLPFAADPGSLTGWLLDNTATETSASISNGLDLGFTRLVEDVPNFGEDGHEEAMKEMADEIINADTLTTYLTATNFGHAGAKISVIHSIARYSAGFGGSNALHGHTLGLLGEMREDQLPMLVRFDKAPLENLEHSLIMEEVVVPTAALVDGYFATATATHLMPQVTTAQGGVEMNLSNLCPIPLAWAPYFMDFKEPYAALEMARMLMASLDSAAHRTLAAPLLDWMRAACTHLGPNAADRTRSLLDQGYEPATPDARVIKWMKAKVAPYQKVGILPAPPPPTGAMGGAVLPGNLATTTSREKEYTTLETSKIQAACGLTDAQWLTDLPELYPRMLEEGRTSARVKALLEDVFQPDDIYSLSAVHIHVTADLAKDVKELNFGYNNDLTYDNCHRGISPFAMIGVSMATASKRRRHEDRFSRTSTLTLAEVASSETVPDAIPSEYHGMISLLKRYVELLRLVVGPRCGHYELVLRITAEINARQHIFEALTARQIASLLWQVFMDARRFFSTAIDGRGNLPQTLLRTMYNEVAAGIVQAHLNTPYACLLGQDAGEPSEGTDEPMNTGSAPSRETKIFRHVPAPIKAALRGVRSKHPAVTIAELMAAHEPPLTYTQVKMGPNGSCLDYLCFGVCKNPRCSYKHGASCTIQATRAETVAPKLMEAYNAYDAEHS